MSEGQPDLDHYLNEISKRSHRGGNQADAPGDGHLSDLPVAPSMAGADEAVDWFVDRMRVPGPPPFLFLIGGPGNGKSFLGKKIVADLNLVEKPEGAGRPVFKAPHKRSYRYRSEHREFLLVNDATFHLDGGFPLMGEVEECIRESKALVVNVNRGVLVEEMNSHAKSGNGGAPLGSAIIEWASKGWSSEESVETGSISFDGDDYRLEGGGGRDFLDRLRICSPTREIVVAAAFLDRCSLFELRPDASCPTAEEPPMPDGPYLISRFDERVESEVDSQSCGGSLLSEVMGGCPDPPDDLLGLVDPIRCNLEALRHEEVRAGVLRIFRAAELLATGSWRMTYRDLWNAIELLTRGRPPSAGEPTSPTEWIVDNQPPSPELGKDRLLGLLRLAQSRFHQAIYGARSCPLDESGPARRTRIVDFLEKADPVRDAISGSFDESVSFDPIKGWASKVLQAFEGRASRESILEAVRTELDDDDAMLKAITTFDEKLDEVVVHCLGEWGNDAAQKKNFQQLISWYAEYLLRLYATANGIPAFFRELVAWTEVWDTSSDPQGASDILHDQVMALLFPSYPDDDRGRLLVPAFGARAKPLTESVTEPVFVKGFLTPQTVNWRTDGDFLQLVVDIHGEELSLDFDFAILREVSACGGNLAGVTDQSHVAVPKLERFRSSMLNAPSAQTFVVQRDDVGRIGVAASHHG